MMSSRRRTECRWTARVTVACLVGLLAATGIHGTAVCLADDGADSGPLLMAPAPEFEVARRLPPVDGVPDPGQFTADINNQSTPESNEFGWPSTSATMTLLPRLCQNGFGTLDLDLNHTWELAPSAHANPIIVTPGAGMHFWSGPAGLDLPPRVYDLYLDISWRFFEAERFGIAGGVTPGLYGDFARFDGDTFQLTGWLLADWTINERWTLVGGVAYVRQLRSHILPVGGIIWRPNEDWRAELMVPRSRVARRLRRTPDDEVWLYLSGMFGGGAWAVDDGLGENALVQYSDLRLSLGVEWTTRRGTSLAAEFGYVFAREIAADGFLLETPCDTLMLSVVGAF